MKTAVSFQDITDSSAFCYRKSGSRQKCKGFTLVELIVVIAIISVIAGLLVPAVLGYVKKSQKCTASL